MYINFLIAAIFRRCRFDWHDTAAVISDILSFSAVGHAAVIEYIAMRKMKEKCDKRKEKSGPRT